VALAGWANRHQLEVIEYLREENRVLKELSSAIIKAGRQAPLPGQAANGSKRYS